MQLETGYLWDLIQVELIKGLLGLKAQSVDAWALAQLVTYLPNPKIYPCKRLTNRHLLSLAADDKVQKQNKRIPLNGKHKVKRRGGVTKSSANNAGFIAFYYLLWIQLRHDEEERMCDNYKSLHILQMEHPRRKGHDVTEAKNIFRIRAWWRAFNDTDCYGRLLLLRLLLPHPLQFYSYNHQIIALQFPVALLHRFIIAPHSD